MEKFGILFNHRNAYRRACLHLLAPMIIILTILIISTHIFDVYANKSYLYVLYMNGSILRSLIWIPIVISFSTFLHSLVNRFAALNSLLRLSFHCFHHLLKFLPIISKHISYIVELEIIFWAKKHWMELPLPYRCLTNGRIRSLWSSS